MSAATWILLHDRSGIATILFFVRRDLLVRLALRFLDDVVIADQRRKARKLRDTPMHARVGLPSRVVAREANNVVAVVVHA